MKHFICLVIVIFSLCIGNAIADTTDIYDLKFERLPKKALTWHVSKYNNVIIKDSVNRSCALIKGSKTKFMGFAQKSNYFFIYQFIPIYRPTSHVQVTLHSKASIYNSLLKVICFDAGEEEIGSDSSQIISNDTWTETVVNINTKGVRLICIQISGIANEKDFKEQNAESKFWMDRMSVKLDGKDIYSVNNVLNDFSEYLSCLQNAISLSPDNQQGLDKIEAFKKYPVIALGESVHGSETLARSAFQIIKYLIEKENCRLVLFEMPFSRLMTWNYYMQQEQIKIDIDSLIPADNILFSPYEMSAFLKWLKAYNATNPKVNIVGIDIGAKTDEIRNTISFLKLFDRNETLDSLIALIYKNRFKKAFAFASQRDTLRSYLGTNNYACLLRILKMNAGFESRSMDFWTARDTTMWQNAKFVIDLFNNAKTAIYTHWGHVNKLNTPQIISSLGYYLNRYYNKDYFVIGLLTGEGSCTSWKDSLLKDDNKLLPPPRGSLEYLCSSAGDNYFYCLLPQKDNITQLRLIGSKHTEDVQFFPFSLSRRMDACIFIKQSKGHKIPDHWPKNTKEAYLKIKADSKYFEYLK